VSHEILINPAHQVEIENTCTKCHAPLGHFGAMFDGQEHYSISEMIADQVALDGVSCVACHQQSTYNLGNAFSGNLDFLNTQTVYGPFEGPVVTPMALYSGYTPEYSPIIQDAGICAACHTLLTGSVDLDGVPTGDSFVEQATYHEWLNSSFSADDITCQDCHMPVLPDQGVILAAGFETPPRMPFAKHELTGANVTMLKLMRDNIETLDIPATAEQFDETIENTLYMLQQQSVELEVQLISRDMDSLFVDVKLTNKSGHKLPSGYPSRKISVHYIVKDSLDNVLFQSGGFDENFYVNGEDVPFENHHDIIHDNLQVQVYEMVMGDVNGNKTTVLERGYSHLKDNRLVPLGFSVLHASYDTTEIAGEALSDLDFNHDPLEGSGSDVIHYHAAINGYAGMLSVNAKVYYQTLPPTWMEEIFSSETPEIETFQVMFDEADLSPVLMKEQQIDVGIYVGLEEQDLESWLKVVGFRGDELGFIAECNGQLELYDSRGQLVWQKEILPGIQSIQSGLSAGTYVLVARSQNRETMVQKLVKSD
jgi:hypothetical protein